MDGLIRFAHFDRLGIPHGFAGSRLGVRPFDARIRADQVALAGGVAPGRRLFATRQAHTASAAIVEPRRHGAEAEAEDPVDGLATGSGEAILLARAADCPLLFLSDPHGRTVGVFHCGWRGIARGMVSAAVRTMALAGADPEGLIAGVSPYAAGCCYEVGDEVVAALEAAGAAGFTLKGGGKARVDLGRAIRSILVGRGLDSRRIEVAPECTICQPDRYHSYRRSGPGVPHMAGCIATVR